MLFFPFLAFVVWYFAGKYRRTWRGVAAVFLGMAVFTLLEIMLIRVGAMGFFGLTPWLVVWLLIVSGVLVMAVAIFIFCMPRPAPPHVHCHRCRYDLRGLDSTDLSCPECGVQWRRPRRCPHCRHDVSHHASEDWCHECGAQLVPGGVGEAGGEAGKGVEVSRFHGVKGNQKEPSSRLVHSPLDT